MGRFKKLQSPSHGRGEHTAWSRCVLATAGLLLLCAAPRLSNSLGLGSLRGGPSKPALRLAAGNTPYYANASAALGAWRSGLMRSMFEMYKSAEAAAYSSEEGKTKPIERQEPDSFHRFDLFNPIVQCPDGRPPRRVGHSGDGGKWLCMDVVTGSPDCNIYSVGSFGQFDFEEAMLEMTDCRVYTFDCHADVRTLPGGRHAYQPICLGNKNETRTGGKQFQTLETIVSNLGHKRVDLLKMDIEGFEYEVLSGFDFSRSCGFPAQISMEVHWTRLYDLTNFLEDRNSWQHMIWPLHEVSLAELAVVFAHLAELGYAVVSREDNPLAAKYKGCCSEFTFLLVERPGHCAA